MPINAQRNSSNTNKPHSRQNIFSSKSYANSEQVLPTSGIVNANPRAANAHPAGAPRALPLDVEQTFDISRDFARLPADPAEKRTHAAPTQTHTSEQGIGYLLQNGEGVPPAGQSANSVITSGMTAPRPRTQAYSQSEEKPQKRGVPIDPDKLHTAFAELQRPPRGVRQDKARAKPRVSLLRLKNLPARRQRTTRLFVHKTQTARGKSSSRSPFGLTRPSRRTLSALTVVRA